MDYKQIQEVNSQLTTVDIKGKKYVEVKERLKGFKMLFPDGQIQTEIVHLNMETGDVIVKATLLNDGVIVSQGTACESKSSSYINKTSFIENCETSALGRAIGNLGIGIEGGIASADDMKKAPDDLNAHSLSAIKKRVEQKLTNALDKVGSKSEVASRIKLGTKVMNEKQLEQYMKCFDILATIEKGLDNI